MKNHEYEATLTNNENWPLYQRILFRFFFIFFILFILLKNNGATQFVDIIIAPLISLVRAIVPWVAKEILHINYTFEENGYGSGDNTYSYVVLFIIFCVSILGSIVWAVIDWKRNRGYSKLYYWLTVAVRFYVGLMLFKYGIVKVIKLQFPYPDVRRLMQPYGESSPMGLAWTFLGFSKGYNLFMGIAEISAMFLLFRRTLLFGVIITLMTTANVMAVNYFYDVPVKILSTMLFIMTLFLFAHDAKRVAIFLFTGKAVSLPVIKAPIFPKKWMRITKTAMKGLIILLTIVPSINIAISNNRDYGENAVTFLHNGLYVADKFVRNRTEILPLQTDSVRWKSINIRSNGQATIKYMNDSLSGHKINFDVSKQKIYLESTKSAVEKDTLNYKSDAKGLTFLYGKFNGDSVNISLTKKNVKDFPLMNRGFHWISEMPHNR